VEFPWGFHDFPWFSVRRGYVWAYVGVRACVAKTTFPHSCQTNWEPEVILPSLTTNLQISWSGLLMKYVLPALLSPLPAVVLTFKRTRSMPVINSQRNLSTWYRWYSHQRKNAKMQFRINMYLSVLTKSFVFTCSVSSTQFWKTQIVVFDSDLFVYLCQFSSACTCVLQFTPSFSSTTLFQKKVHP